jgi:small GTP-binding protein
MDGISKKICMVGDFGVGKTSLIRRFVDRQFSDRYLSTVGVKISRKAIPLPDRDPALLNLLIWDLEGQTKFKAITSSYLQGSSGILIVADGTRPETLASVTSHMANFLTINPQGHIAVALNKSDLLATDEQVAIGKNFAQLDGVIGSYWTSAKTGCNVDRIFEQLARHLVP